MQTNQLKSLLFLSTVAAGLLAADTSHAVAMRSGFNSTTFAANDDLSEGPANLGFSINFFGNSFSQAYVNNNGNITFDAPLGTFTPFPLLTTSTPMLAPFFADVDTRASGSALTKYGTGSVDGHSAWGVTWDGVGYFGIHDDLLNKFQLVVIDRSDIGAGDFDFEFNYDQIQWETGDASGGANGVGGAPARAGWANGLTSTFEIAGAGVAGAYLDGGPNSLVAGGNVQGVAGRFLFQVRNGTVINPTPLPDAGSTLALLGFGLTGLVALRRKTS